jgi:REP element-mobilizing transposase RayT
MGRLKVENREMADTYYSINIHYVFSTKGRVPFITGELMDRLPQFIGGILRQHGAMALSVGGTADHLHILASLPASLSVSKAAQLAKGGSSKWVHEAFPDKREFSWQEGYAAFSVSVSQIPATVAYIENQAKHHLKKSFMEEYISFLKRHGVEYDERYLWG